MVVTMTEAVPLPVANVFGFTAQVVAVAATGREQDKLTCALKPLRTPTAMVLVNVAVWPAFTVCVVVPELVTEKSGGGGGAVTVKFTGAEVPPGAGSTTYRE